jgi:2-methylcitrate dehydratase PrpD
MNVESRLVEFINRTRLSDVPASAMTTIRRVLMAVSGTGVAGAGEEGIAPLRRLLLDRGGRAEATSLVFGDRLPAASAALLNGTMCRALDFCDAMAPGVHVGSSVVPAALAAAELMGGASGEDFMVAVAVGTEIGARFNLTEQMYNGFDPTGIAAVFGAAAAAGRLMRLSDGQMLHALALAFNRCGGSFQSNVDGSLAVRLQQGLVAEAGLVCAQMAKVGLTGPRNFMQGHYGFVHLYAKGLCTPEHFIEALGQTWRCEGFMFKRFPSCGVTQGVTQQALEIARELSLSAKDVAKAQVRLPPYAHRLVGNAFKMGENPRVNAQFSAQYCVANAISRGASRLEHFTPEAVRQIATMDLIPRIEVVADATMDARGHSAVDLWVQTRDGRGARRSFDIAPGYPGNALSDADHHARFDDCMSYAAWPLEPAQIGRWVGLIDSLQTLQDVRDLLPLWISAQAQSV